MNLALSAVDPKERERMNGLHKSQMLPFDPSAGAQSTWLCRYCHSSVFRMLLSERSKEYLGPWNM